MKADDSGSNMARVSGHGTLNLNLNRNYTRKRQRPLASFETYEIDEKVSGVGRILKKKCQLSPDEISEIIKSVNEDKLTHWEAGVKHNVSHRLV